MNIYISHSTNIDYRALIYQPILNSSLYYEHNVVLPHKLSTEQYPTKEFLKHTCELVIADISYPSTGQGIELGWADIFKVPIACIYSSSTVYSNSLKSVSKLFYSYDQPSDVVRNIRNAIKIVHK